MTSDTPLSPGETVDQRYVVREKIGSGGFATVYRAREEALGRDVALKVLDLQGDPFDVRDFDPEQCAQRFRREAKLVARLGHPSTVTLHDFGSTADGSFYMALEFVDGTPLSRGPVRPVPPARLVRWLLQALGSLAEAHDYGVLHRDLKPSNLMLTERPGGGDHIKLIDFGIAKPLRTTRTETLRPLTAPSRILGTPRYVAPEYVTEAAPCPASDLYSLGLLAHELLLDRKPVPGQKPMDILGYHLSRDYRIAIPSTPAVPEHLRRIVNRMTARPIDERYRTATELREDLASLPELPEKAATAPGAHAPTAGCDPETTNRGGATEATPELDRPPTAVRECRRRQEAATPPTDPYCAEETELTSCAAASRVESGTHRTARERPQPAPGSVRITADDEIHSDGPAIDRETTPPPEDQRERRISVPPGKTLAVRDRPEPDASTTAADRSRFDWRDALLAAVAVVLLFAACATAVTVL